MPARKLKSTPDRYGFVAVALHRTLSVLILLQIVGGLAAVGASAEKQIAILKLHAPLGILIGLVAALRIFWWVGFDRRPNDIAGMSRAQSITAHVVHGLLYLLPLAAAFTGYALLSGSGAGRFLSGEATGEFPDLRQAAGFGAHWLAVMLLIAFIALHVGAAVYHQVFQRDNLLARMRRDEPAPPTEPAPAPQSSALSQSHH
jgi:cytochrome b561